MSPSGGIVFNGSEPDTFKVRVIVIFNGLLNVSSAYSFYFDIYSHATSMSGVVRTYLAAYWPISRSRIVLPVKLTVYSYGFTKELSSAIGNVNNLRVYKATTFSTPFLKGVGWDKLFYVEVVLIVLGGIWFCRFMIYRFFLSASETAGAIFSADLPTT